MKDIGTLNRSVAIESVLIALEHAPDSVKQCQHVYRDAASEPLEEGWIKHYKLWFRFDGFHISSVEGYVYPGRLNRWRIRRLVKRWKETNPDYRKGPAR